MWQKVSNVTKNDKSVKFTQLKTNAVIYSRNAHFGSKSQRPCGNVANLIFLEHVKMVN